MTPTLPTCPTCSRPIHDQATLCTTCGQTMTIALANAVGYALDLDLIRTRRTRYSTSTGGRTTTIPMPVDLRARQAEDAVHAALLPWAIVVFDQRGYPAGTPRQPTLASLLAWLQRHVDWFRHRDDAPQAYRAFLDVERQLRHLIDRPPDKIFAGLCGCIATLGGAARIRATFPGDLHPITNGDDTLYAQVGDTTVRCPVCHRSYDVADCRATMLAALDDRVCTAAEIADLATYLGDDDVGTRDQVRKRINQWMSRDILEVRTTTPDGDPAARFGDAFVLLMSRANQTQAQRAQRQTTRRAV